MDTNLSSSELLNLLIDGELEVNEEPSLFAQLAGNDELRSEFREFMTIRSTLSHDAEAFTPPLETTNSVFSRLDMIPPIPSTSGFLKQGTKLPNEKIFLKRIWVPVLTAILASLFTGAVFMNYYEGKIADFKKQIPTISSIETTDNNIPSYDKSRISSKINEINNQNSLQANSFSEKSLYNDSKITGNQKLYNFQKVIIQEQENSIIKNMDVEFKSPDETLQSQTNIITQPNLGKSYLIPIPTPSYSIKSNNIASFPILISLKPEMHFYSDAKTKEKNYQVILRGINARSFPETAVMPQAEPIFSNISLATMIKIADNHKLGFEFGQEQFSQVFTNIENNSTVRYEQNPMVFWMGFAYQYEMDKQEFLFGGQPFGHLFIGSTEIGPLSKAILGLQYITESGIGVSLGIEGSLLLYENQKIRYTTKKLGFTYGLSYSF